MSCREWKGQQKCDHVGATDQAYSDPLYQSAEEDSEAVRWVEPQEYRRMTQESERWTGIACFLLMSRI